MSLKDRFNEINWFALLNFCRGSIKYMGLRLLAFLCLVALSADSAMSRRAIVTLTNVSVDTKPPTIVGMTPLTGNSVRVQFSEPMDSASNLGPSSIHASGPGLGSLSPQPDSTALQGDVLDIGWLAGFGISGQTLQISFLGLALDSSGNPLVSDVVFGPALPVGLRSFSLEEE